MNEKEPVLWLTRDKSNYHVEIWSVRPSAHGDKWDGMIGLVSHPFIQDFPWFIQKRLTPGGPKAIVTLYAKDSEK